MHAEIWQGKGGWFWNLKARNGKIVSDAESFPSKAHALRAAKGCIRAILRRMTNTPAIFDVHPSADGRTILRWM